MSRIFTQQLIAIAMCLTGMSLMLSVMWFAAERLGGWYAVAIAGSILISGGAMLLVRLTLTGVTAISAGKTLSLVRDELSTELSERAEDLNRREQQLAQQFVILHQWLEFPQPVNLNADDSDNESAVSLAGKDRELIAMLEMESETLFDNIRANKYAPGGKFDPFILRDDVVDLVERVAKLYRPDLEQPILETSLARVVPAASRACLHFLVALEQLPINVKDRSLSSLYSYVQRAVKAYGAYRKAKPLFPYLNSAYYMGRFAFGANPLTLGAWWFLGELGKRSAEAVVTKVVNRQAIGLLHNMIRIVGFEVAGIYGGDFRHRDANWVYAVELTDLARQFPLTSNLLAGALKELSAIDLRCEFDRAFLYRCLAERHSADPQRYPAENLLPTESRQAIAKRLEQFVQQHIPIDDEARIHRWREGLESRLGVQVLANSTPIMSEQSQREEALRSLASFLIVMKQVDADDVAQYLQDTQTSSALSPEALQAWQTQFADNPPSFVERPQLDPRDKVVVEFFQDLLVMETTISPRNLETDDSIFDLAAFLRQDVDKLSGDMEQAYISALEKRSCEEVNAAKLPSSVARAVLDLLGEQSQLELAHRDICYVGVSITGGKKHWLIGLNQTLYALSLDEGPQLIWKGVLSELAITKSSGLVTSECQISGGRWLTPIADGKPTLKVHGSVLRRFNRFMTITASESKD